MAKIFHFLFQFFKKDIYLILINHTIKENTIKLFSHSGKQKTRDTAN